MLQFPKDIDEFDFCASLLRYRFSLGWEAALRCDIGVCSVLCASRKRIRSGQVGRINYVFRFYVRCHCKSLRLRNRVSTCKQCCSRNIYKNHLNSHNVVCCVFGAACICLKHVRNVYVLQRFLIACHATCARPFSASTEFVYKTN